MSDGRVWLAFLAALLLGGACLLLGVWVTRRVGLLDRDAPAGETLGVGLGSGLLIFAAWWAAIGSGGRSSFTPVALAFLIAVVGVRAPKSSRREKDMGEAPGRMSLFRAAIAGAAFVVVVGLIYGATMAPSPRNGEQPLEFRDEAYYSSLAMDLNRSGIESNTYSSGFDSIQGFPSQNWYHWGEMWISAAAIRVFGIDPVLTRHYVVLPLLLLAAAALTGTLVRRMARTTSRRAFLFGAAASMFLAPLPLLPGSLSGWWAVGLLFGITLYGLAVIAALISLYVVVTNDTRRSSPALQLFSGAAIASMLPTHVVVAFLALVGAVGGFAIDAAVALARRRRPRVPQAWRGILAVVAAVGVATLVWGVLTGHVLGATGKSAIVAPFNQVWVQAIASNALAAGGFLAIPFAWFVKRDTSVRLAGVFLGTVLLVVAGAVAWGARLAEFDAFHVFFAGIVVFAIPVAAAAIWTLWLHLRDAGRIRLAIVMLVLCGVQVELGILPAITRLQVFGPGAYPPIPQGALAAIRALPAEAKLAYACKADEDFAFFVPGLVSIYAHTGRRVVPMCFALDISSGAIGADPSARVENPVFKFAPQRALYRDETTRPSSASVAAFLKDHDIGYIYADTAHPNSLIPDALPIASNGGVTILEIP